MRTPRPWIDTHIYICIYIYIFRFTYKLHIYTCLYTHSDIHTPTRMYTICICTHTHIYIYISPGPTSRPGTAGPALAPRLPANAGRAARLWWQGFEELHIYIYIWMCLKMACPMSMDYSLVSQITVWRAYTRPMFKHVHIYIIFQKTVINNFRKYFGAV